MRICLLTNQDLLADPFASDDWPCDPRPFYPDTTWEVEYLKKSTSVDQVTGRIQQGFDLFFNLCDGAADQSIPFFVALKGASFGRCDLRVDRNGTPFMLEINPNYGVYYPPEDAGSADLCLVHDPDGHVGSLRAGLSARRYIDINSAPALRRCDPMTTRREALGMLSAVIAPVPFARRQLCASRRKLTNDS
jgi:hypothetical protein